MTVDEKLLIKRRKSARRIRYFRKIHRQTAVLLFLAFFIMAGTGLLLAWKKNSGGLILAKTESGTSTDLSQWLPLDSLKSAAVSFLHDSISPSLSPEVDRMDVRPAKGIVKFTFIGHYKGLQVDGATGKILKVENRNSDLIEQIHDGSILDFLFGTGNDIFKLIYSTIMGIALLLFTITGVWIWWGPKRMRKHL
jgi:hypothetical protein